MTLFKKTAAILLALIIALSLMLTTVSAYSKVDLDRDLSLTVNFTNDGVAIVGAELRIYLVATMDEYGNLTTCDDYSAYNVNITGKNDEAWLSLANTLNGYISYSKLPATDTAVTDASGSAYFPSSGTELTAGLYLVLGSRHYQDGVYYDVTPFMVMLPMGNVETNEWIYDVVTVAKHECFSIPYNTVDRKVLKIWNDEGSEEDRPESITVYLIRNDEVYEKVVLSDENNWRHTWYALDGSAEWTIFEQPTEGYSCVLTREGITFILTNTPDEEDIPEPPNESEEEELDESEEIEELPQTGQLWWPIPVLLCAGLALIVLGLVHRRG